MKTVKLNYDQAHEFVEKNEQRGYFWNGWDIARWVPNHDGYAKPNGMYRKGLWGFCYKFPLNNDGTWSVKVPNV